MTAATPPAGNRGTTARRYFRTDASRMPLRSLLRLAGWRLLLGAVVLRLFPRPSFHAVPRHFEDSEVAESDVAARPRQRLAGTLADLRRLGFAPPLWQAVETLDGVAATWLAWSRAPDGSCVACASFGQSPGYEQVTLWISAELPDGRVVSVSNRPALFDAPPTHVIRRRIGAEFPELLDLHRATAHGLGQPRAVGDDGELRRLVERLVLRNLEFQLASGAWVEVTPDQLPARPGSGK